MIGPRIKGAIVGLVIGAAVSAAPVIAGDGYWEKNYGSDYACAALARSVECTINSSDALKNRGKYTALLYRGKRISLYFSGHAVFTCKTGYDPNLDCTDVR